LRQSTGTITVVAPRIEAASKKEIITVIITEPRSSLARILVVLPVDSIG
jgi:hypothetical protein